MTRGLNYVTATLLALTMSGDFPRALGDADRVVAQRFVQGGDAPLVTMYTNASGEPGGWEPHAVYTSGDPSQFLPSHPLTLPECIAGELRSFSDLTQLFPFNSFVHHGIFTDNDVASYLKSNRQFTNRPFSMLVYLSDRPTPDGMDGFGQPNQRMVYEFDYDNGVHGSADIKAPPKQGFYHATLMITGGQRAVPDAPIEWIATPEKLSVPEKLPWMVDPEYAGKFDEAELRRQYPFLWEFRRGARTERGQFPTLLGFGAADVLRELSHIGFPAITLDYRQKLVESSAVTFHSVSKDGFDTINNKFPDRIFRRGRAPYDAVFVVPLKELLTVFPPEQVNPAHRILSTAISPPLSPLEAQRFITMASYGNSVPLDFRYRNQVMNRPLLFNTRLSGITEGTLHEVASQMGLSETQYARLRAAGLEDHLRSVADPLWPGIIVDPLTHTSIREAADLKGLQIANLDPAIAERDPEYIKAALVAAFDQFAGNFAANPAYPTREELQQAATVMKEMGFRFMISTHYATTAGAVQRLGPEVVRTLSLASDPRSAAFWGGLAKHGGARRPAELSQTVCAFSIDQVLDFRGEFYYAAWKNPALEPPRARPGYFWWLKGASSP